MPPDRIAGWYILLAYVSRLAHWRHHSRTLTDCVAPYTLVSTHMTATHTHSLPFPDNSHWRGLAITSSLTELSRPKSVSYNPPAHQSIPGYPYRDYAHAQLQSAPLTSLLRDWPQQLHYNALDPRELFSEPIAAIYACFTCTALHPTSGADSYNLLHEKHSTSYQGELRNPTFQGCHKVTGLLDPYRAFLCQVLSLYIASSTSPFSPTVTSRNTQKSSSSLSYSVQALF